MSNKQNKLIKELISKLEQDGVDVSKYTQELDNINNNLKDKKYGLVWEQHTEPLIEDLKSKVVELQEVKERRVFKGEEYTNNFLIEGDNLESLNALLKSGLEGKIKVIAIDPPYNTGNKDFVYNDKYVDKENSFRHSKWLSFMEYRLKLAKRLMADDGSIFIHIDSIELAQLKLLCDFIFGEDNYLNTIIWHYGKMSNETRKFANNHEYILVYGKSKDTQLVPKIKKEDTEYKNRWIKYIRDNKLYFKDIKHKKDKMIQSRIKIMKKKLGVEELDDDCILYDFDKEFKVDSDTIYVPLIKGNSDEKVSEFGIGQKPIALLNKLYSSCSEDNDIILDFFAGSGSTAVSTLVSNKLLTLHNRRFILCTNNENNICEDITYQRLNKVINGYTTPKGKEVEGIPANLTYLKTNLINKEDDYIMYDNNHLEYIINLLKLNYGITNELDLNNSDDVENKLIKLSSESQDIYIYLNDYIDEEVFNKLELSKEKESIIYVDESLVNDKHLILKGFKNINSVNKYFK